jgi:hypothetical protein
MCNQWW